MNESIEVSNLWANLAREIPLLSSNLVSSILMKGHTGM